MPTHREERRSNSAQELPKPPDCIWMEPYSGTTVLPTGRPLRVVGPVEVYGRDWSDPSPTLLVSAHRPSFVTCRRG